MVSRMNERLRRKTTMPKTNKNETAEIRELPEVNEDAYDEVGMGMDNTENVDPEMDFSSSFSFMQYLRWTMMYTTDV